MDLEKMIERLELLRKFYGHDFVTKVIEELRDMDSSLKLIHESDMRAINRFHEAFPEKRNMWPDRTDLVFWLLSALERYERFIHHECIEDENLGPEMASQIIQAFREGSSDAYHEDDPAAPSNRKN